MLYEPENFREEKTTVWSFPDRGSWATHDWRYRGNWSPRIPRNLIQKYSKIGDTVLDQFVGGGTTLVEAKLLRRNVIGVDVNDQALSRCRHKVDFHIENELPTRTIKGDARDLNSISDDSIDLICTHPPYANIIKYSDSLPDDLSNFSYDDFLAAMKSVAQESFRVLKRRKVCAIMVGDMRRNGKVVPLGFSIMQIFQSAGFSIKEIIIKEQHNCKSSDYWNARVKDFHFLLLAHEYIFVFEK
jgi:DNA modification methylase